MLSVATDSNEIGRRIAARRQELRLSQDELAARLGVSPTTVGNWETGKHYPKRHLGALEAQLRVNLRDDQRVLNYATQDEAFIWSLDRFSEPERRRLIDALRQIRGSG